MNKKKIFLKTEDYANLDKMANIKQKYSLSMRNYNDKFYKANSLSKHRKIKLKQKLLINLLKQSNIKNIKKRSGGNKTHSIISYHSFNSINDNILNTDFKNFYNLNKNFHNLPGLSKFHNLTDEKMNNLIKTETNLYKKSAKSFNNINSKPNLKIKSCENNSKEKIFNNRFITDKNIIIFKNKEEFLDHSKGSKKVKIKMNKFKKNLTNSLLYLRNEKSLLNNNKSLSSYIKNEKAIVEKITTNIKKMKLNKSFNPNKCDTQIWMASIKDLIKNDDAVNMGTKKDKLIFYIERPEESYDLKPIDKYQLLKNQIAKHKKKFENIIKEMKLNQIKNEYLMKKYIFDLVSRKKKIY